MDRNTEVRIFVLGDEHELRPLTADNLLGAMKESRELINEYGGYSELIEKACVISRGLFTDEGERIFQTGREALQSMTAEEIDLASSEYIQDIYLSRDRMADVDITAPEFDGGYDFDDFGGEDKRGKAESAEALSEKIKSNKNADTYVQERGREREDSFEMAFDAGKVALQRRGKNMLLHRQTMYTTGTDDNSVYRNPDSLSGAQVLSVGKGNGMSAETSGISAAFRPGESVCAEYGSWRDMTEVSDFFERDSRRYDSAIKLY